MVDPLFVLPDTYITAAIATLSAAFVLIAGPKIFRWAGRMVLGMFR